MDMKTYTGDLDVGARKAKLHGPFFAIENTDSRGLVGEWSHGGSGRTPSTATPSRPFRRRMGRGTKSARSRSHLDMADPVTSRRR